MRLGGELHAGVRRAVVGTDGGHAPTRSVCELLALGSGGGNRRARTLVDRGALLGQDWPLTHDGAAHALPDLRGIHMQLCKRSAQRIAMHTELGRSFALITTVVSEDLKDIALLELPNRVRVGDSGGVHLSDQGVQFALQGGYLTYCQYEIKFTVDHSMPIDPDGRVVVDTERAACHQFLKVFRYEEGYIMRDGK